MYVSIPREHVWRRSQAISEQQPLRLVYRSLCQNTTASESQQLLQKSETELGDVTISRWDGHVWPVWGRADPPTKTLSHVSRVLAVHRQYHLHHLYLALTMPNLLMNLDPMLTSCVLTSCAVKEHDPLDYILLPLPKMSSFMIGVTALL